jgi:thiol-disulfide isomerase/thioredoxin
VEDGTVLTLHRLGDSVYDESLIASDTLKDGRFIFKGEAESNYDKLRIRPPRGDGFAGVVNVWAAPKAKIKVTGIDKFLSLWEVKSSVPYQKEQNRYINASRDILAEQNRIGAEINDMLAKRRTAVSEDEAKAYIKIADSLGVIFRALVIKENYNNITIMGKADITKIWLINMYTIAYTVHIDKTDHDFFNLNTEQTAYLSKKAEELYGRMSEEDKNSTWGKLITAYLFPASPLVTNVGDYFADVDLLDASGNTKRTADYLGKYILLDFWASWCVPCITALPEMKEISETYRDKLTIISISFNNEADWKEAMIKHDMPWVNLRDPNGMGGLAAAYGVAAIPNYVLISPEGIVIEKWAGYARGLLKQKVSENIQL